jgi:hypothetical protein
VITRVSVTETSVAVLNHVKLQNIISDRPRAFAHWLPCRAGYLSLINFIGLADYIAEAFPNGLLAAPPGHFAAGYRRRTFGTGALWSFSSSICCEGVFDSGRGNYLLARYLGTFRCVRFPAIHIPIDFSLQIRSFFNSLESDS